MAPSRGDNENTMWQVENGVECGNDRFTYTSEASVEDQDEKLKGKPTCLFLELEGCASRVVEYRLLLY